ncbi:Secreted protein [Frankia sp. AgKG'84/4]
MARRVWVRPHVRNGRRVRGYWRGGRGFSRVSLAITAVVTFSLTAGGIDTAVSAGGGVSVKRPPGQQRSARNCSQSRPCTEAEITIGDLRSIEVRLARKGLQVNGRLQNDGTHCADHSYGTVLEFFREHPCAALYRAQFQGQDKKGDVVLIAVSWVRMADQETAAVYKKMVDAYGTGNVTELSREGGKYRTVRYTARNYASGRRGNIVVNAQAEPVVRGWGGIALATIANEAAR